MNVQRGDIVLVDYPYAAGGGANHVRQGQGPPEAGELARCPHAESQQLSEGRARIAVDLSQPSGLGARTNKGVAADWECPTRVPRFGYSQRLTPSGRLQNNKERDE